MTSKPLIFLSAVSCEFGSLRQSLAHVLARSYQPIYQDAFPTEAGKIREILRRKIESCAALIQIVGDGYGAEPPEPDALFGRVSYTQYELLYAASQGKKIIVLMAGPDCRRDAPVESLDLPPADAPGSDTFQAERRRLQREYRESLGGYDYPVFELRSLDQLVLVAGVAMKNLEYLQSELEEWKVQLEQRLTVIGTRRFQFQEAAKRSLEEMRSALAILGERERRLGEHTAAEFSALHRRLQEYLEAPGTASLRILMAIELAEGAFAFRRNGPRTPLEKVHDTAFERLLTKHDGWELERSAGRSLLLFRSPAEASRFALTYQELLRTITADLSVRLEARIGIAAGEVMLRPIDAAMSAGARYVQIEEKARRLVGGVVGAALSRQILLTYAVFELTRQSADFSPDGDVRWLAHGPYRLAGVSETEHLFEVGKKGLSALTRPLDSAAASRALTEEESRLLGWVPFPGEIIPGRPHWRLVRKLGSGGFGETWHACYDPTGDDLVFKFCLDPTHLAALKRNVVLLRGLKRAAAMSGTIADIVDWHIDQPPFYVELKYYSAGSLAGLAEKEEGLASLLPRRRIELLAELSGALDLAHRNKVIHGDIKPQNVLIEFLPNGRIRPLLADFGTGTLSDTQVMLAKGITIGTTTFASSPASLASRIYLAPELLEGNQPNELSDIYAFGILAYQVMVGDLTRAAGDGWEREVDDPDMESLIASCLQQKPVRRPKSFDEIVAYLRPILQRPSDWKRGSRTHRRGFVVGRRNDGLSRGGSTFLDRFSDLVLKLPLVWMMLIAAFACIGYFGYQALPEGKGESRLMGAYRHWAMLLGLPAPAPPAYSPLSGYKNGSRSALEASR